MSSISNSLSDLSFLTQPGGILSNLPAQVTTAELQSASPKDLVTLSMAAMQSQEVDGLYGISTSTQTTLPGVSGADLAHATPQQQSTISEQAQRLQEVQALFAAPAAVSGCTNILA